MQTEKNTKKILLLPGDGIGPEVFGPVRDILEHLVTSGHVRLEWEEGLIGGIATDRTGLPLPPDTIEKADRCDAVLLGAVGGPKYDALPYEKRPERALLGIREHLGAFANLRPARLFPELAGSSTLKPEIISDLDLMVVRELTGGIYFGKPRGIVTDQGVRRGINTETYTEPEIARIMRVAFDLARTRRKKVTSVDKANVLESSVLWREVAVSVHKEYPDVELSHMYVDNAAMQLVRNPKQFDVLVTGNLFGDILSDEAAQLTGSIGMLASASIGGKTGLYEPIHGSAPDIAGKDIANPLAMILSLALLFRYSLQREDLAGVLERSVQNVLKEGYRTTDIQGAGTKKIVGTREMGSLVFHELKKVLENSQR
ncbi:3-isopropylmalate dehydrogenase [Leptospirillum ferriphilum]|uniref:3-isopropylmalate dehydrogenase n=3 Tax=Leptospirillum ferriphilum TaxID=178606 RepID=A0A1V3SV60_9BACT|nr:3-isopropylmalate dehydrogenase [Leptospirillum ferriphilum]OOH71630.1 3-isopropylmalate dehydrogenase [Leptospirillum ferriphilum]OOH83788.1 3-isopropylmalate dehydrogenase [Leptospirillum ferriphilum]